MSDRSLLSFPILKGKQAFEMEDMSTFLGHGLNQVMQMMQVPEQRYVPLLEDMSEVALAKNGGQSVLGLHCALASDYDYRVKKVGDINESDLGSIIAAVNQTPRAKLKSATSFEVTLALLGSGAA